MIQNNVKPWFVEKKTNAFFAKTPLMDSQQIAQMATGVMMTLKAFVQHWNAQLTLIAPLQKFATLQRGVKHRLVELQPTQLIRTISPAAVLKTDRQPVLDLSFVLLIHAALALHRSRMKHTHPEIVFLLTLILSTATIKKEDL